MQTLTLLSGWTWTEVPQADLVQAEIEFRKRWALYQSRHPQTVAFLLKGVR